MRFEKKAFPHPVLRPEIDDYTDTSFETSIDIRKDEHNPQVVCVGVQMNLSNDEIWRLINNRSAFFCLDVYCAETMYRGGIRCSESQVVKFEHEELYGKVDVLPTIVVNHAIKGFRSGDFNPEYGGRSFDLVAGDILAYDESVSFIVEFEGLSFESLIRVETSPDVEARSYSIDVDSDMIAIRMGKDMRVIWDDLRGNKLSEGLIGMSILKDCVLVALWNLSNYGEEVSSLRWARALQSKLDELAIEIPPGMDLDEINRKSQGLVAAIASEKVLGNVD